MLNLIYVLACLMCTLQSSEAKTQVIWKEWLIVFRFILMRMLNKHEKLDNDIQGVVQVVVAIQSCAMSYGVIPSGTDFF